MGRYDYVNTLSDDIFDDYENVVPTDASCIDPRTDAAENVALETEKVLLSLDDFKVYPDVPRWKIPEIKTILSSVSDSARDFTLEDKGLIVHDYRITHNVNEYRVLLVISTVNKFQHSVKVMHPDRWITTFIDSILHEYKNLPSKLEITWDFILKHPAEWCRLFKSTIYVKNCGLSFDYYAYSKTSTAFDNPQCTLSKAARLYLKQLEECMSVRFEIIIKRRYLKRKGINSIDDWIDMDSSTMNALIDFIELRVFDFMLFKRLFYKNDANSGIDYSEVRNNILELIHEFNLVEAVRYSKQFVSRNCTRLHPFNSEFKSIIQGNNMGAFLECSSQELVILDTCPGDNTEAESEPASFDSSLCEERSTVTVTGNEMGFNFWFASSFKTAVPRNALDANWFPAAMGDDRFCQMQHWIWLPSP